jgi:O-antigen/teichoic acid export membrane protein
MSRVKFNIIANYVGSVWQMAMGILFVPLYIRFLGIESYGIIGFFTSLTAVLSLLDMGLSTTFSREIVRIWANENEKYTVKNTLATFSRAYWIIALIAGVLFIGLSPGIATHWLKAEHTSISVIRNAIILMGLSIVVRWPGTIYLGGINGLQKQTIANIVVIIISTIRGGGVVLLLWLVSPTLNAFFSWQIGCYLAQTMIYSFILKSELRDIPGRGVFEWNILKRTWKLSAGLFGINLLGTLLSQADKIVVSKFISLEQFGYYALAGSVAAMFTALIVPINGALFPRFTELVALRDEMNLRSVFHLSCQLVSFIVFPVWAIMAFFPKDLLYIWTHDQSIAKNAGPILSLLATAGMLNMLMHMPSNIQTAYGYTRIILIVNSLSLAVMVPLLIFFVQSFGTRGGAYVLILINGSCIPLIAHFMYKRFLKTEKWLWYVKDMLRFALPCIATFLVGKYCSRFFPETMFSRMGLIGITTVICFAMMLLVMPRLTRAQLIESVAKIALR